MNPAVQPRLSGTPRIRAGRSTDLDAIAEIEAAAFTDPWTRAGLESELHQRHSRVYVLEVDSRPVAALLGWLLFDELQINRVAVVPALRRCGLGRSLVYHALRRARAEDATAALLEVRADNTAAIGLYEVMGFLRTGVRRHYYRDGTDAVLMRLDLSRLDALPRAQPGRTGELPADREHARGVSFESGVYAILDTDRLGWVTDESLEARLDLLRDYGRAAADAGACALQLRVKSLPARHPLIAQMFSALLADLGPRLPVVLNDDIAALHGLERLPGVGLHLGQHDARPVDARRELGPGVLLGLSTHSMGQVRAAASEPVDYLGFGPIHATNGKAGADPVTGVVALEEAVRESRLPIVAIGGLDLADLQPVRSAGAHAAAVIGAWLGPAGRPNSPTQAGAALAALTQAWRAAG